MGACRGGCYRAMGARDLRCYRAEPISLSSRYIYRVRTQGQISARLALDMWREAQAEGRHQTLTSLHRARAG